MEMAKYSALSEPEQLEFQGLCTQIVFFSEKARYDGLASLEVARSELPKDIPNKKGLFMEALLGFILDGVEYTVIEELAANYMNSSCENGTELLFFMMIAKGMLHLQRGTNPAIIADVFARLE